MVCGVARQTRRLFVPLFLVATVARRCGGGGDGGGDEGPNRGEKKSRLPASHNKALVWLEKLGPKACLLAWLPGVGDPLCAVAGWLKLPFWPCVAYMAIGKFARYVTMTVAMIGIAAIV